MTTCGDIRAAALRGEGLVGGALEAHLRECPACAELARAPTPLVRALAAEATAGSPAELEALLRGVTAQLDGDAQGLGRLRSLPTWARYTLAIGAATGIALGLFFLAPRADLATSSAARLWATLAVLALTAATTVPLALRPAHKPALSPATTLGASLTAIGVLVALALLPAAAEPPMPMTTGELLHATFGCFYLGTLLSLPVYVLTRLLDRQGSRLTAVLAATYAGVAANLALQLHCPNGQMAHLMLGHVSVAAVLAGLAYVIGELVAKRR